MEMNYNNTSLFMATTYVDSMLPLPNERQSQLRGVMAFAADLTTLPPNVVAFLRHADDLLGGDSDAGGVAPTRFEAEALAECAVRCALRDVETQYHEIVATNSRQQDHPRPMIEQAQKQARSWLGAMMTSPAIEEQQAYEQLAAMLDVVLTGWADHVDYAFPTAVLQRGVSGSDPPSFCCTEPDPQPNLFGGALAAAASAANAAFIGCGGAESSYSTAEITDDDERSRKRPKPSSPHNRPTSPRIEEEEQQPKLQPLHEDDAPFDMAESRQHVAKAIADLADSDEDFFGLSGERETSSAEGYRLAVTRLELLRCSLPAPCAESDEMRAETGRLLRFALARGVAKSHLFENCTLERGAEDDWRKPSGAGSMSPGGTRTYSAENIEKYYELDYEKPLGCGSYGRVLRARRRRDGALFACKTLAIPRGSEAALDRLHAEISAMRCLDHPNICRLHEVYYAKKRAHLLMDLCTGGELWEFACTTTVEGKRRPRPIEEARVARFAREMLSAVRYMHEAGFCHRDLKPQNWLLATDAPDAPLKLVDFGLAKRLIGYDDNPDTIRDSYDTRDDDDDDDSADENAVMGMSCCAGNQMLDIASQPPEPLHQQRGRRTQAMLAAAVQASSKPVAAVTPQAAEEEEHEEDDDGFGESEGQLESESESDEEEETTTAKSTFDEDYSSSSVPMKRTRDGSPRDAAARIEMTNQMPANSASSNRKQHKSEGSLHSLDEPSVKYIKSSGSLLQDDETSSEERRRRRRRKRKEEKTLRRRSQQARLMLSDRVGSFYFVAPEVLRGAHDARCDLWSIGVIVYMLLSGSPPFSGKTDREILERVARAKLAFPPRIFSQVSAEAKNFVSRLLDRDVERRLTAAEALQENWITRQQQEPPRRRGGEILSSLRVYASLTALQKLVALTVAARMPPPQLESLRADFAAFDADFDGALSLSEFFAALGGKSSSTGSSADEKETPAKLRRRRSSTDSETLAASFSTLGQATEVSSSEESDEETVSTQRSRRKKVVSVTIEEAASLFDACDVRGTARVVSYREFVAAAMCGRLLLSEATLRDAFETIDLRREGTLGPRALRAFVGTDRVVGKDDEDVECALKELCSPRRFSPISTARRLPQEAFRHNHRQHHHSQPDYSSVLAALSSATSSGSSGSRARPSSLYREDSGRSLMNPLSTRSLFSSMQQESLRSLFSHASSQSSVLDGLEEGSGDGDDDYDNGIDDDQRLDWTLFKTMCAPLSAPGFDEKDDDEGDEEEHEGDVGPLSSRSSFTTDAAPLHHEEEDDDEYYDDEGRASISTTDTASTLGPAARPLGPLD